MMCRKLTPRRKSRRRSRSIASSPTEVHYEAPNHAESPKHAVSPKHAESPKHAVARKNVDAHKNYETRSNYETRRPTEAREEVCGRAEVHDEVRRRSEVCGEVCGRTEVIGEVRRRAEVLEEMRGRAENTVTRRNAGGQSGEDVHSDSDDEFYVKAVHSTFSDCSGRFSRKSNRSRARSTRRTSSGFLGTEAPGVRFKNSLMRLGRYTKDVVVPKFKGVFGDSKKVTFETDTGEGPTDGYSRLVNGIVSIFYARDKAEEGDVDDEDVKHPDDLLPFLTGTNQLTKLYRRRRGADLPSRTASEFSSGEVTDMSDLLDEPTPPLQGVGHRSANAVVDQWKCSPGTATPSLVDDDRYSSNGTPRDATPRRIAQAGACARMDVTVWFFQLATVLLLAAVVYKFELVAVTLWFVEMSVPKPVMAAVTAVSLVVVAFLLVRDFRNSRLA